MERPLIDFQESSVDPTRSVTPSPQGDLPDNNILKGTKKTVTSSVLSSGEERNSISGSDNSKKVAFDVGAGTERSHSSEENKTNEASKTGGGILQWPWSKRDRLKRDPSLDKLDEEGDVPGHQDEPKACPDYFGVRSYLHNFYEWQSYKDPDVYEDEWDDSRRLLYPGGRHHRCRCTATWWKAFVFMGALLLVIGTIAVLIGYLMPQKSVRAGYVDADRELIDLKANEYNQKLDMSKLIGLILFCAGGLTLAMALMVPSFLYRYCDDERHDVPFSVQSGDMAPPCPVKDPSKNIIPASARLTEIQPARKIDEEMIYEEGGDQKFSLPAATIHK